MEDTSIYTPSSAEEHLALAQQKLIEAEQGALDASDTDSGEFWREEIKVWLDISEGAAGANMYVYTEEAAE